MILSEADCPPPTADFLNIKSILKQISFKIIDKFDSLQYSGQDQIWEVKAGNPQHCLLAGKSKSGDLIN